MTASKDYLYPDLSVQLFRQVEIMRRLHVEHPDYFTADNCPYPEEVGRYFRSWFDTPVGDLEFGSEDDELLGDNQWDALYREVVGIFTSLKNAKPSAGDSSESMAYFRTATSLLEKLVSHQERCLGIKQIHEFHQTVIDIMENELTDDQRASILQRMKNAIKSN